MLCQNSPLPTCANSCAPRCLCRNCHPKRRSLWLLTILSTEHAHVSRACVTEEAKPIPKCDIAKLRTLKTWIIQNRDAHPPVAFERGAKQNMIEWGMAQFHPPS